MANTFVVSRSHLIYGVCLPLAVLLGYLLSEPRDSGSVAVMALVLSILSIPILMRFHHPLLIFGCNSFVCTYFLPGRPSLWMVMAFVSLFFSVLNRALHQDLRFFQARAVSQSLLFLGGVVFITAYLTGGIGIAALGGSSYGGRKYIYIFAAIMLYFAISTPHTKRDKAGLYMALFNLSALTSLAGYVAAVGGPAFYFLDNFFPIESAIAETTATAAPGMEGMTRLGELGGASTLFFFLAARYGVRGILDVKKPWRLALVFVALLGSLLSGFRSNLILMLLTFALMFYMEGLFKTRYFMALSLTGILAACIILPNLQSMPLSVQRTLSFLPINIDPVARDSAEASTQWRLNMWGRVVPDIPKYLLQGKGYALNPDDLYLVGIAARQGFEEPEAMSMLAGDYHSGPLSVIIPFGIFGAVGFIWFLVASFLALRQNYRFGDPSLHLINTFLYALFIVRVAGFFFIFGSLHSDLPFFAGLVGMSVSLNGGVSKPAEDAPEGAPE
ncbi:MAG: O-Antigen ligase [Pedosphaera sp.]|nr:O-Antigen ligase [Pedosphaera sp.]